MRRPRRLPRIAVAMSLIAAAASAVVSSAIDPLTDLRQRFDRPPDSARIMMRWWWFGPAVTRVQIERDLRAMKDAGIGGVEVLQPPRAAGAPARRGDARRPLKRYHSEPLAQTLEESMVRLTLLVLVTASSLLFPAPASAQGRAIALDDLAKVRDLGDPQRSPDGKWVAYTVRSSDVEKDKRDVDLWMTSWDGTEHVRLTSTPEDDESHPRWSPNGRHLAFLATRGDDEQKKKGAQVWLLNRAGGEAVRLTDIKGGVAGFAWAPDSARLALVVEDFDPDSDPEKKEGWKRKTKPPLVISRYYFKNDEDGYLRDLRRHLSVIDVASRRVDVLTSGRFSEWEPAWSPDGKSIAFLSERGEDPDRTHNSDVFVMPATPGAEPRQLTTFEGEDHGPLSWSPDGQWIAYLQADTATNYAYDQNVLAIVPAAGGPARLLTTKLDRPVFSPSWADDGKSIHVTVADDRAQHLLRVSVADGTAQPLTTGRRVVHFYSAAGRDGGVAAVVSTSTQGPEVWAVEKGALRRLSAHNDEWAAAVRLSGAEDVTFTAKDGTVVNGLLTKPAGFAPGRKHPLLLYIHGGPNGQDDHSFDFDRELFAAHGYLVLQVNYRGSNGRGAAFQKAIHRDWGNKEVVDLLAGVDWAIASGLADPDRLGIGGWSYGGILTNYTIATDSRFKAAVSGAGSSLQLSMYGVDQYIVQYEAEMGQPWKAPDAWMKVSYPFFRADRIKTPTLFLCGEKDFNVPIAGSEQMYQALKSLGLDTQLIVYPGQHHGLTIPSYQRDRLQRYLDWWGRYLLMGSETRGQRPETSTRRGGAGLPRE